MTFHSGTFEVCSHCSDQRKHFWIPNTVTNWWIGLVRAQRTGHGRVPPLSRKPQQPNAMRAARVSRPLQRTALLHQTAALGDVYTSDREKCQLFPPQACAFRHLCCQHESQKRFCFCFCHNGVFLLSRHRHLLLCIYDAHTFG